MLSGALTIYLVADLRDLARLGKATVDLEALEAPIDIMKVLEILKENKETLKESGAYEDIEERLTALENLKIHNTNAILDIFASQNGKAKLVEFVDVNAKEELVHAITVNPTRKRITVTFRGSVTTKDFITDAKVGQIKVDNPAYNLNEKTSKETFRLHYGFHEYLFINKCPHDEGKSRYEGIIFSLKNLLKENPGYKVYCTGHSLGGALCTIFGFFAAANDEITELSNDPIRVISIASPYVGNAKFLMAFQSLERLGRLRHLRVANAEDLVSLMPIAAPKLGLNIKDMKNGLADMYRHCGIKLHLNDLSKKDTGSIYKFVYPLCEDSDDSIAGEINSLIEDGKNFVASIKLVLKKSQQSEVLRYHSCEEYELRINSCKDFLQKVTLEGLYKDTKVVGKSMDPDYEPKLLSTSETFNRIGGSSKLKDTLNEMLSKN